MLPCSHARTLMPSTARIPHIYKHIHTHIHNHNNAYVCACVGWRFRLAWASILMACGQTLLRWLVVGSTECDCVYVVFPCCVALSCMTFSRVISQCGCRVLCSISSVVASVPFACVFVCMCAYNTNTIYTILILKRQWGRLRLVTKTEHECFPSRDVFDALCCPCTITDHITYFTKVCFTKVCNMLGYCARTLGNHHCCDLE